MPTTAAAPPSGHWTIPSSVWICPMSDHDFNTPPWFLDLVREMDPEGGKRIGLDPCSNPTSSVDARKAYTEVEDGLEQPWIGHRLVFMNPPHSQSPYNIEPWMERAYDDFITLGIHRNSSDQFLGLVPAKTDTAWFHDYAFPFHKCFIRGRIKFWQNGVETKGNGKFANLVIYAGIHPGRFRHVFRGIGVCL